MDELPTLEDPVLAGQLRRVASASQYFVRIARQHPETLAGLLDDGDLRRVYAEGDMPRALAASLEGCDDNDDFDRRLRRFRQREMLRILWRDFNRVADTMETTRDTSRLAEACIAAAQDWWHRQLAEMHGRPRDPEGNPQELVVIAMGKLGAAELNLSSDVDLIFAYPRAGGTDGEDKPLSNEEYFIKLGRRLIASIDRATPEGFVFRVDMRLRPYGQSGALVLNFAAMQKYYRDQGRDWERYALIKARPITGTERDGKELMLSLRPFVYRRYIDFGAIESLREMKGMIDSEVRRRGIEDDVKLGPGGIREVEFIAQCFQIIRGGRSRALRRRKLLPVLDTLVEEGYMTGPAVEELKAAYLFLRNTEHAIQGYDDRQSQKLPSAEDARQALLVALDFPDWESFTDTLDRHRARVEHYFSELIAPAEGEAGHESRVELWPDNLEPERLVAFGFEDGERVGAALAELRDSNRRRQMQSESRERLNMFVPRLLQVCAARGDGDEALLRLLPMVQAVVRRSVYLVMLLENPDALEELVLLCAASPWIAEQLTHHPVLLEQLLDAPNLYAVPDRPALQEALRRQLARLAPDDLEANMDTLRYFKATQVLGVAASELTGRLPLMKVSDKLTFLAEVILEQALKLAWFDLVRKHGRPRRAGEADPAAAFPADTGFAILGYGKLGGIELGYGSDLDMVFIFDAAGQGVTDGERQIDNSVFYTRLGQRIIHILDTRTAMGQLYEVDMRLRPSGDSGMLVASFAAFRDYQLNTAWTWEHQALVRSRFIAGDEKLGRRCAELRREVLVRRRPEEQLREEVTRMRDKMREHLLPANASSADVFHLKHGRGGIVDIEFMVQYAVLAWSHRYPELTTWSDNIRILETLRRQGLFTRPEATALTEAYIAYRSAVHQQALQQQEEVTGDERFREERAAVRGKWEDLLGPER